VLSWLIFFDDNYSTSACPINCGVLQVQSSKGRCTDCHTMLTVIDKSQHFRLTHFSLHHHNADVYSDTNIPMHGQWDRSLFKCLTIRIVSDYGYACILEAALWYEQCITLSQAKESTLDLEYLQCLPVDRRQASWMLLC
jgi:hypothetical protein